MHAMKGHSSNNTTQQSNNTAITATIEEDNADDKYISCSTNINSDNTNNNNKSSNSRKSNGVGNIFVNVKNDIHNISNLSKL